MFLCTGSYQTAPDNKALLGSMVVQSYVLRFSPGCISDNFVSTSQRLA